MIITGAGSQRYSRSLSADHPFPPLLRLPDIHITADPPVAKSEGVSHRVTDVGPADDCDGDAHDGVENGHNFTHRGFRSYVSVS